MCLVFTSSTGVGGRDGGEECLFMSKQTMTACGCEKTTTKVSFRVYVVFVGNFEKVNVSKYSYHPSQAVETVMARLVLTARVHVHTPHGR